MGGEGNAPLSGEKVKHESTGQKWPKKERLPEPQGYFRTGLKMGPLYFLTDQGITLMILHRLQELCLGPCGFVCFSLFTH